MDATTRSKNLQYDGGKTPRSGWRGRPRTFLDRVPAKTSRISLGELFKGHIKPATQERKTRHSRQILERSIVESELFCSKRRRCAPRESQGVRGKSTRHTQTMNDSFAAALYLPALKHGVSREFR